MGCARPLGVVLTVAALALLFATAAAGRARLLPPRLSAVHTWAFAIGDGTLSGDVARRYAAYDLVVVDGQEVTAAQVRSLRRDGALVLGYLDAGTIEPYRPWYRRARPYRLDYWKAWGEWYANVDAAGYRRLVAGIAASMLRKRLDGLFLDNTDMVETHPSQASGMRVLVARLATLAHRRGGFLFAQNGADVDGPILRWLDGWNREDIGSDPVAAGRELRRMRAHGLLTLATGYVNATNARAVGRDVAIACTAGALPFVSNRELTRIPATPVHC